MRQEDYNDMMRRLDEVGRKTSHHALPKCPVCNEAYCGDGRVLCLDCSALATKKEQEHE